MAPQLQHVVQCGLFAGQAAAAFFQVEQCHFGSQRLPFADDAHKDMFDIDAAVLPACRMQTGQALRYFLQQLLVQDR